MTLVHSGRLWSVCGFAAASAAFIAMGALTSARGRTLKSEPLTMKIGGPAEPERPHGSERGSSWPNHQMSSPISCRKTGPSPSCVALILQGLREYLGALAQRTPVSTKR
jgi:hypothetical protein